MLVWYVADFVTGAYVERLPLKVTSLERVIGQKVTTSATLDAADPSVPPLWQGILNPERSMLVAVDDDYPLAAYRITDAPDLGGPTVPLSLESIEGIVDRVNVRDLDFGVDTDESDVAAALLDHIATAGGFDVDVTPCGTFGDHVYSFAEDRKVGSALEELRDAEGGPEWTIHIRWADADHRRFIKTFEIGPQVGRDRTALVVGRPKHLAAHRVRSRSWAHIGVRGDVFGDGVGQDRPASTPVIDQAAIDAGVFPWEVRKTASTASEADDLDRTAQATQARWRHGTQTWSAPIDQANADRTGAPRIGHDYDLGDMVTVKLDATPYDAVSIDAPARQIGWQADVAGSTLTKVTSTFWAPDEDVT